MSDGGNKDAEGGLAIKLLERSAEGQTRQGHRWKLYASVKDAARRTGDRRDRQRREGWEDGGGSEGRGGRIPNPED